MEFLVENKSSLLLALGVGLLTFFMMRSWSRRLQASLGRNRNEPRSPLRVVDARPSQPLLDAPPEITRWQVEMHDLARDLRGELETKIAVLQRLVIDAQEAADRLDAAIERAEAAERVRS